MAVAEFLIDTSALQRVHLEPVLAVVLPLTRAGRTATCGMVDLEVLYSPRNAPDHARSRRGLAAHEWLRVEDQDFGRAIEVQGELAATGRHRAAALPDLLIAAVAERHRVSVLHYDADFDLIAELTGQPVQWVVPRGSVG